MAVDGLKPMAMRGVPIVLLAFAGLLPANAAAGTEIRLVSASPVALTEPRADAVLAAGAPARLAWRPLDGGGEFDEWEAFLSLDGGASYPLRITPELDLDLHQAVWRASREILLQTSRQNE